jgi:hypothetical protein
LILSGLHLNDATIRRFEVDGCQNPPLVEARRKAEFPTPKNAHGFKLSLDTQKMEVGLYLFLGSKDQNFVFRERALRNRILLIVEKLRDSPGEQGSFPQSQTGSASRAANENAWAQTRPLQSSRLSIRGKFRWYVRALEPMHPANLQVHHAQYPCLLRALKGDLRISQLRRCGVDDAVAGDMETAAPQAAVVFDHQKLGTAAVDGIG